MMICHNYDIACVRTQYYLAVFCSPAIQLYCCDQSCVIWLREKNKYHKQPPVPSRQTAELGA